MNIIEMHLKKDPTLKKILTPGQSQSVNNIKAKFSLLHQFMTKFTSQHECYDKQLLLFFRHHEIKKTKQRIKVMKISVLYISI